MIDGKVLIDMRDGKEILRGDLKIGEGKRDDGRKNKSGNGVKWRKRKWIFEKGNMKDEWGNRLKRMIEMNEKLGKRKEREKNLNKVDKWVKVLGLERKKLMRDVGEVEKNIS